MQFIRIANKFDHYEEKVLLLISSFFSIFIYNITFPRFFLRLTHLEAVLVQHMQQYCKAYYKQKIYNCFFLNQTVFFSPFNTILF